MLFVPLPLFATLLLSLALVRFCLTRNMQVRAHQLFALLVGLYAVQSLLASLRWGYGLNAVTPVMVLLAPVLPAVAYMAYRTLSGHQTGRQLWPLGIITLNWLVYALHPDLPDPVILMTYLGFGVLLLRIARKGIDQLSLSAIDDVAEIRIAIYVTGISLIASGLTDIFIIYDFVQNGGRAAPFVISFVQTAFVLAIGISGVFGRSTVVGTEDALPPDPAPGPTLADSEIVAKLEYLFETEKVYREEDISLRRLARKIRVPDRQVSNAINRVRNVSVSQFVNGFRIQEACGLLKDTDRTVLEISLASGFASKSNFNREFSRVTGLSPTQWRQAHGKTE